MNILKEDVDKVWENNQFSRNFEFLWTNIFFPIFLTKRSYIYQYTCERIYNFFNLNNKKFYYHVLILEINVIYRLIIGS